MKDTTHSGGWKDLCGTDGYSIAGVTPRCPLCDSFVFEGQPANNQGRVRLAERVAETGFNHESDRRFLS
jgi:hypothetical protein